MHKGEIAISEALVRRLLAGQFPEWADLPIMPVRSAGTVNAIFRLGDDLSLRLPRIVWGKHEPVKEHRLLPKLAPHLPLAIPVPLALGMPDSGYPWHWTVNRWLEGENVTLDRIDDEEQLALDLAGFITTLHSIDTGGRRPVGVLASDRGEHVALRDAGTREAIAACRGLLDVELVTEVWDTALYIPAWEGAPVWLHTDINAGNLLARNGRLSAVIDWGGLALGDPAVDLIVAWDLLMPDTRGIFRAAMAVDDATWARGRAWALSWGLVALPYYVERNPLLAGIARYAIEEVVGEYERGNGRLT
jgi:aminoglycoside phosphotransferase (APT) family kinase protein